MEPEIQVVGLVVFDKEFVFSLSQFVHGFLIQRGDDILLQSGQMVFVYDKDMAVPHTIHL